jgi:hypothetical protein
MRHMFKTLVLIATTAILCGFAGQAAHAQKQGISYSSIYPAQAAQAAMDNLGQKSWYYNWSPTSWVNTHGRQFVPMVWGAKDVTTQNLTNAKTYGDTLLTFNEPDGSGQANLTPAQALNLWPTLQATGLRLGSPATASDPSTSGWMDTFMKGAAAKGYRVDFMTLHSYPGTHNNTDPAGAVKSLMTEIDNTHKKFNKPIWLTEISLTWANDETPAQELAFMKLLLPQLEACPYLERYCWYTTNFPYQGTKNPLSCSLADANGKLLPLGIYYKNFAGTNLTVTHTLSSSTSAR